MPRKVKVRGLGELATIISCYDYRLSDEILMDRDERHVLMSRLRRLVKQGAYYALHAGYVKPLNITSISVHFKSKDLFKAIYNIDEVTHDFLKNLGIPLVDFIDTITLSSGNSITIRWYTPPGIDFGEVEEWALRVNGEFYRGVKVPIQTCKPRPSAEDVEELGRRLRELLGIPL